MTILFIIFLIWVIIIYRQKKVLEEKNNALRELDWEKHLSDIDSAVHNESIESLVADANANPPAKNNTDK